MVMASAPGVHEANAAMPSAAVSASSRFLIMFSFRLDAGARAPLIHTCACGRENAPAARPPFRNLEVLRACSNREEAGGTADASSLAGVGAAAEGSRQSTSRGSL